MKKTKSYTELCIENYLRNNNLQRIQEASDLEKRNNEMASIANIYDLQHNKLKQERLFREFSLDVKKSLLAEVMVGLMENSIGYQQDKVRAEVMQRNLVNNFIEEKGAVAIIKSMKDKSYVLSEFARVIEKYSSIIIEKVDKQNSDTFIIQPEDKDNFFDELKTEDNEAVENAIRLRVADAVEQFINANIKQKEEIKEVLKASQEKIDDTNNEEVQESYKIQSKTKINNIKEKRTKTVLEQMVYTFAESSMKNETLKEMYAKDNKLDMDSIVENCTIMYAFLETVNTAMFDKVDSKFIDRVLSELKM
ncbi:MAG: hypothetical protein ACRDD7_01230 [Peptostreptococcaceae bacterium]